MEKFLHGVHMPRETDLCDWPVFTIDNNDSPMYSDSVSPSLHDITYRVNATKKREPGSTKITKNATRRHYLSPDPKSSYDVVVWERSTLKRIWSPSPETVAVLREVD